MVGGRRGDGWVVVGGVTVASVGGGGVGIQAASSWSFLYASVGAGIASWCP